MDKLVRLHHGGRIVRTRDDSVQFEDMFEDVLIFSESPTLTQLVDRVKVRLGWSKGDVHAHFQGVIDVGSSQGPRIKRLLKITSESEWSDYKSVVLASEVRCLDVVISKEYGLGTENIEACRMVDTRIENGPSMEEEEIVLTQPTYGVGEGLGWAEGDQGYCDSVRDGDDNMEANGDANDDIDDDDDDDDDESYGVGEAEEALDDASGDDLIDDDLSDEADLSGDFGDARATNRFDLEVARDDETFVDELAKDSDDDRPVRRLNYREIEILRRVLPDRDPLVPDFEDLSHGHRAVADGGPSDTNVPDVSGCSIIRKGILFATMDQLKSWL
jgi:hypothetical protein